MDFVKPQHIKWIIEEKGVVFEDGVPLSCFNIAWDEVDDTTLNEWATHIRRHYIRDNELANDIAILKMDEKEYLKQNIIPQKETDWGPQTISGEMAEILLYDLFEYILQYTAFRGRHWNKDTPTATIQGSDVIVAKMIKTDGASAKDELCIIEVKANLQEVKPNTKNDNYNILKEAKKHSDKDSLRYSVSLNAMRKRYYDKGETFMMNLVARFQDSANSLYIRRYIAAGVVSRKYIKDNKLIGINGAELKITLPNQIFLIHGERLMQLAYDIYGRITK